MLQKVLTPLTWLKQTTMIVFLVWLALYSLLIYQFLYHGVNINHMMDNINLNPMYNNNIIEKNFNLSFIHIPKTGGSMVENLLYQQFNISVGNKVFHNLFENNTYGHDYINLYKCGKKAVHHVPLHKIKSFMYNNTNISRVNISKYYFMKNKNLFTIVRNPYNRFLSEYKYCLAAQWCFGKMARLITKENNITIFDNERSKNCNKNVLNKWTSFILNYLLDNYPNNLHLVSFESCHYIPQFDYIYDEYGMEIFNDDNNTISILKTETLSTDLYKLLKLYDNTKYGINSDLIDKYHNNSQPSICKELAVTDLNSTNIRMLQMFYHKDFITFNYSLHTDNG